MYDNNHYVPLKSAKLAKNDYGWWKTKWWHGEIKRFKLNSKTIDKLIVCACVCVCFFFLVSTFAISIKLCRLDDSNNNVCKYRRTECQRKRENLHSLILSTAKLFFLILCWISNVGRLYSQLNIILIFGLLCMPINSIYSIKYFDFLLEQLFLLLVFVPIPHVYVYMLISLPHFVCIAYSAHKFYVCILIDKK